MGLGLHDAWDLAMAMQGNHYCNLTLGPTAVEVA
jgi:hypothetical protein